MRGKIQQIRDAGGEVLAIDPHESWSAKHLLADVGLKTSDIGYPLLADPGLTVSATYGVAFQMRIHTEWSNRPATFIVDREGILRYARRGKTYADRPTSTDILGQIDRL